MSLDLARLAIVGSRGSRGRLLAIAAGVAIGVAILLVLWGARNGLHARDERSSWTLVWGAPQVTTADGQPAELTEDSLLAYQTVDYFRDERIMRVGVATLPGTTVPFPAGITPPAPGEYYASPALADLIDSTPSDQLGDRYGTRAGILPDEALVGPDALVVMVGYDPAEAAASDNFELLSGFNETGRSVNQAYQTILVIGGIAVFFPVVLFISIVTQLGAAQRQESFATLRLIGAPPRTVVSVAAVEMAVTSLVGAIAGVVLSRLVRPLAAMVPINGETSFTSDFEVSPTVTILVVIAMVAVSTIAAASRIRRAGIGPLGGSRQLREGRPSWLRVLPLLVGIGTMLLATLSIDHTFLPAGLVGPLLILGFTVICLGLVVIGPWVTYQVSRLVSRAARSAEAVIACSRILATPAATFRSVGGLVVAVFLVSVFAGSASVVEEQVTPREAPGLMPVDMLTVSGDDVASPDTIEALWSTDGVTGVIPGHAIDQDSELAGMVAVSRDDALALGFEHVPEAGWVGFDAADFTAAERDGDPELFVVDPDEVGEPDRLYVATDGSPDAIERARTAVDVSAGVSSIAMTRADLADFGTTRLVNSLAVLAYLGIFFAVTIAGISLAVSTVAAMLDRKRVLGLMRLMGMPAGSIRRIIGMEAAVPLAAVLGGSIGLGFLVAWMIVTRLGNGDYAMGWPDPLYFVTLAVSLALAVLSISTGAATVNRNTSVSATRFE